VKLVPSPWIDEELSILQDATARFIERNLLPQAEAWLAEGKVSRDAWRQCGEAGLLCVSVPEAYGGGGGNLAHEAIVHQEFSRAGLGGSIGVGNSVSSAIVAHYILEYGSEAQKERWLPGMARGERIAALAMTEPGTGSDLRGIRTKAEPCDGGYRLNGQKTFITNGQNADLVVVAARSGTSGSEGISLLVVETEGAQGFRRGRNLEKIGMHGQDTSELFFDDVFVPEAHLLGEVGSGFLYLVRQLAWERLLIALDAVVNTERAVGITTAYVRERRAFGSELIQFQNTQFVLAECATLATVGRTFVDELVARLLRGELDADTAAMAKLWATETQCKVIDQCLQLFGGYGYMAEYPIARLYADARVSRIYGGTSEIMKVIISRAL
jgi:acyl-CoA dehydrogenase